VSISPFLTPNITITLNNFTSLLPPFRIRLRVFTEKDIGGDYTGGKYNIEIFLTEYVIFLF